MNLTHRTLKTIHTLLVGINKSINTPDTKAGETIEPNIFNDAPYSQDEADIINTQVKENIKSHLEIVLRLLDGEKVPEFLDSDY